MKVLVALLWLLVEVAQFETSVRPRSVRPLRGTAAPQRRVRLRHPSLFDVVGA